MRRLVLGGARSGKSRIAEDFLATGDVDYVATSTRRDDDPDWGRRIALHIARRPVHWRTLETLDLPEVLAGPDGAAVLVDSLTAWLTSIMDTAGCWSEPAAEDAEGTVDAAVAALVAALGSTRREVVFVSDEVGQGVVPASASGRLFRDRLGLLNQRVAAVCDEVWFVTAGLAQRLKG